MLNFLRQFTSLKKKKTHKTLSVSYPSSRVRARGRDRGSSRLGEGDKSGGGRALSAPGKRRGSGRRDMSAHGPAGVLSSWLRPQLPALLRGVANSGPLAVPAVRLPACLL